MCVGRMEDIPCSRTYLQEVRPLQGPWWNQLGQGNSSHLHGSRNKVQQISDRFSVYCSRLISEISVLTVLPPHLCPNTTRDYNKSFDNESVLTQVAKLHLLVAKSGSYWTDFEENFGIFEHKSFKGSKFHKVRIYLGY